MLEKQETFKKVSESFVEKLKSDGLPGIMVYRPFDESYWTSSPRIVICNFENYGYHDEKSYPPEKPIFLTFKVFQDWLRDGNKTAKYSSVFINGLKEKIAGNLITEDYLKKSFKNIKQLEQAMKNVTYMNLRPTSGAVTNQDVESTNILVRNYKDHIKNIILSLHPDIFIISSEDGTRLINYIFDLEKDKGIDFYDTKNNYKQIDNFTAFSIKHFSRSDYSMYINKIEKIISIFNSSVLNNREL